MPKVYRGDADAGEAACFALRRVLINRECSTPLAAANWQRADRYRPAQRQHTNTNPTQNTCAGGLGGDASAKADANAVKILVFMQYSNDQPPKTFVTININSSIINCLNSGSAVDQGVFLDKPGEVGAKPGRKSAC